MGKLYLVGTPIGNLGDFSSRGKETLNSVDFIAAEDTRVSRKLLTHFGISVPIISYHQHNSREKGVEIVERLLNGENCALITDAGMPAISDPGEDLVKLCHESNIPVVVVPGPSAVTSALAISGINSRKFVFEGFLEGSNKSKKEQLLKVKELPYTLVYYEAPHRLLETLSIIIETLGNRNLAICREITKLHEQVLNFSLEAAIEYYKDNLPRGEFVLVIEGNSEIEVQEITIEKAIEILLQRDNQGVPLSQAAKEVSEITGFKKNLLYKKALEIIDNQN